MRFRNRVEAGKMLAKLLTEYANRPGVLVLALPRGGVPVAHEIAQKLNAPLDVFVVRKLGVPGREELAMGVIASGGERVLNKDVVDLFGISHYVIDAVAARERGELERREFLYRDRRPELDVHGRTVIVVDDGIATGSTMRVALKALRQLRAGRIIVATPTAAESTANQIRAEVDEFVAVITPKQFSGVGEWYEDFSPTSDDEVRELLVDARQSPATGSTMITASKHVRNAALVPPPPDHENHPSAGRFFTREQASRRRRHSAG